MARQFLQVGEQRLESTGAPLDHFAQAGDLQAQGQACFTVGQQLQLATAHSDQLGELIRLLVQTGQDRHGLTVVGLIVDDVPVNLARHGLVRLERDLADARAQPLSLLGGQGQPTGVEQKVHRLSQIVRLLAGKQRAHQAVHGSQHSRSRRKVALGRAAQAQKLDCAIMEHGQAAAPDLHVVQDAAGQIRGLGHGIQIARSECHDFHQRVEKRPAPATVLRLRQSAQSRQVFGVVGQSSQQRLFCPYLTGSHRIARYAFLDGSGKRAGQRRASGQGGGQRRAQGREGGAWIG